MELSEPSRAQKNRCYVISSRVRLTTPADGLGMKSQRIQATRGDSIENGIRSLASNAPAGFQFLKARFVIRQAKREAAELVVMATHVQSSFSGWPSLRITFFIIIRIQGSRRMRRGRLPLKQMSTAVDCLIACLPACLSACMLACLPACLSAWMAACM